MTVTNLTKANQKDLKPMHLMDVLTDEQKAVRMAKIHEEWMEENYQSMVRKVAKARKELGEFAVKLAELAGSTDQSPLYEMNRRSVFETAVKIEVLGRCIAMREQHLKSAHPDKSFTAWYGEVKKHALQEALRSVRNSCSTSPLDNYVDGEKADQWRKVYEGFYI